MVDPRLISDTTHAVLHEARYFASGKVAAFIWSNMRFECSLCNLCKLHELRDCHANRTCNEMEARFACGSMVRFLSFSHKCGSVSHICVKKMAPFQSFWEKWGSEAPFFPKKDIFFRPAGGEKNSLTEDRVTRINQNIPGGGRTKCRRGRPCHAKLC